MTVDTNEAPPRSSAWASIVTVWVLVALAAVATVVFAASGERLQWFPIILGAATILSFCLQLALDSKVGFVNRLTTSVAGAVVLLALATGLVALLGPLGG